MLKISINAHEYSIPTKWEEVTVNSFIEVQKIEDHLLPVLDQMKLVKELHVIAAREYEAAFFSKDELEMAAKKSEVEDLEEKFNRLIAEYNELSIQRLHKLSGIPMNELLSIPAGEIERYKAIAGLLYDAPFDLVSPELEENGVWSFRVSPPNLRNVKQVFYCKHLAEYPACVHQVYHAMVKKIQALTEDARLERTDAELELAALFLMPKPEGVIYLIIGDNINKLDFDTGKFNEQLNKFWDNQKKIIGQLPITFLKSVISFFLNHWQSYFANLSLMPITDTGMEMS